MSQSDGADKAGSVRSQSEPSKPAGIETVVQPGREQILLHNSKLRLKKRRSLASTTRPPESSGAYGHIMSLASILTRSTVYC